MNYTPAVPKLSRTRTCRIDRRFRHAPRRLARRQKEAIGAVAVGHPGRIDSIPESPIRPLRSSRPCRLRRHAIPQKSIAGKLTTQNGTASAAPPIRRHTGNVLPTTTLAGARLFHARPGSSQAPSRRVRGKGVAAGPLNRQPPIQAEIRRHPRRAQAGARRRRPAWGSSATRRTHPTGQNSVPPVLERTGASPGSPLADDAVCPSPGKERWHTIHEPLAGQTSGAL